MAQQDFSDHFNATLDQEVAKRNGEITVPFDDNDELAKTQPLHPNKLSNLIAAISNLFKSLSLYSLLGQDFNINEDEA